MYFIPEEKKTILCLLKKKRLILESMSHILEKSKEDNELVENDDFLNFIRGWVYGLSDIEKWFKYIEDVSVMDKSDIDNYEGLNLSDFLNQLIINNKI